MIFVLNIINYKITNQLKLEYKNTLTRIKAFYLVRQLSLIGKISKYKSSYINIVR